MKDNNRFNINELWYLLYGLCCGIIQMIKIYESNPRGEQIDINMDMILLN